MKALRLNPHLLQIPLWVIKRPEQIRRELGLNEVIELGANENPLGPSPLAIAALREAAAGANRYPDAAEPELRRKLAAFHGNGLSESHFIFGSGASDVLRMIAQAFIFDGAISVTCRVTFPIYALLTTMFGGETIYVEPRPDYQVDLEALGEAITPQTQIVWLCSPNNPTGLVLHRKEMDAFVSRLPEHVVVVFDEPYADFVTDPERADGLRYVRQGCNVVVIRSFSKTAGLANLRVGYGIAPPELIECLQRTNLPFNTSGLALVAAAASLDDHAFRRRSVELVQREREFLFTQLSQMGLACLPSQANFLVVLDPPCDVQALADALLQQGIIVRPMRGFGLPNGLRVSVGLRDQNERFLGAMRAALAGHS